MARSDSKGISVHRDTRRMTSLRKSVLLLLIFPGLVSYIYLHAPRQISDWPVAAISGSDSPTRPMMGWDRPVFPQLLAVVSLLLTSISGYNLAFSDLEGENYHEDGVAFSE